MLQWSNSFCFVRVGEGPYSNLSFQHFAHSNNVKPLCTWNTEIHLLTLNTSYSQVQAGHDPTTKAALWPGDYGLCGLVSLLQMRLWVAKEGGLMACWSATGQSIGDWSSCVAGGYMMA